MVSRIERLKSQIQEELSGLNNTEYYHTMKELSEWAQGEAYLAYMGWRNGKFDDLQTDDDE